MFDRRNLCSLSLALLCATGLAGCGGGGSGEEDRGAVENSGTGTDTTAPSVPTSVVVVDTAERSVQLSWSAASDDVGVTGYEILRDGQVVGSTAANVLIYTDTGLVDGVNYIYHVRARDGRGNVSAPSVDLRVVARSNADKRPPSPPSGLQQQGGTSTSITLSWQAASDNVGVTGYDARDAAGNWSLSSAGLTASPSSVAVQDIVAPTVPSGLKVEGTSPDSVVLSWTAATDNVAVTAYDLFRDGKLLVNLNSKVFSYADTGLNASSTYTYTVQARDGAGNTSSLSAAVTAKTTAATPSKDSLAPPHRVVWPRTVSARRPEPELASRQRQHRRQRLRHPAQQRPDLQA
ncbi:MAG: fibronectin type III domain-containing protein [Uliginosibacterium sp.]|nr:fibronectin type III domain-containing protein [Uliginosibacterium sp.]